MTRKNNLMCNIHKIFITLQRNFVNAELIRMFGLNYNLCEYYLRQTIVFLGKKKVSRKFRRCVFDWTMNNARAI